MAKWVERLFGPNGTNVKGTKKMVQYLQQGDVLLHEEKIPTGRFEVGLNPILQHGEHTGHKHELRFMHEASRVLSAGAVPVESVPKFRILTDKATGTRYLKIDEVAYLVHEEHKTISVQPGEYRIGIVREYDHFKEEAREVVD